MKTTLLTLAIAVIACTATAQYSYQDIFQDAVSGLNHVTLFGGSTDFEAIDMSDDFFAGNTEEASISTDDTVATAIPAANRPANYSYAATRDKVLDIDTPVDVPVFRNLNADGSAPAFPYSDYPIYADMLVKGTPHKWNDDVQPTSADDKILVYFKETAENGVVVGTNLYVRAGAFGIAYTEFLEGGYEYKLTTPGVASIEADAWYRIVIVSIPATDYGQGFQIYFGGFGPAYLCTGPGIWFDDDYTYYSFDGVENEPVDVFLSMTNDENFLPGTMTSLGFAGHGAVDDFVVSTADPARVAVTLSWPNGLRDLYCVVGTATNSLENVTSPLTLQVPADTEVALGGYTGYRFLSKSLTVSDAGSTLSLPEQNIFWYFPQTDTADQDGTAEHPFEIATESDLYALQTAVTNGYGANLCYAQVDDIGLTAPWPGIGIPNGKDICGTAEFDAGAFSGTYDGGNYMIFDFQMVGVADNPANNGEGLDYCGFFNSTYNATIKNFGIQYAGALFAADTTASTKESGATFVGVAKNSTLQNLTSFPLDDSTDVSCSKGFGGIVGYLMAGSTVESCTNNVNIISLAANKAGGIAMITQNGSGSAVIRNCQNNGTTDGKDSQKGGIVGYVGVATTIDGCEDTASSTPTFLHFQSGSVTMQGVNKASADFASYTTAGSAIDGLAFATVDNGVATFVKNADLAADNTYMVMGPNATATYQFTAPGSISFETALYTPTFAITADDGLTLSDTTSGALVTYTAVIGVPPAPISQYKVEIGGVDVPITPTAEDFAAMAAAVPGLDTTDPVAVNAVLATPIGATGIPVWQAALLGLPPTEAGLASFKVSSISFNDDGKVVVTLPAGVSLKTGRGVDITLKLMGADDPSGPWSPIETAGGTDGKTFTPVTPAVGETAKFYKVVVVFAATPQP